MPSLFFRPFLEGLAFLPFLFSEGPPKSLFLSRASEPIGQGKTTAIFLSSPIPLQNVEGIFLDRKIPFFLIHRGELDTIPSQFTYRALLGIPIETEPGSYPLRVTLTPFEDSRIEIPDSFLESRIQVIETAFEREEVTIPPSKGNLLTSDALQKEAEIMREILAKSRRHQYWQGEFLLPIEGRISSPFGIYRIYNDGTSSRPHRGVDIANLEGTPILAPNSGKIVLSRHFEFHGNTLIIDHGQGIYSILNHLKRRYVQKGDKVKKGETVGLVGETGLATGPHLHWGLSVLEVRVDALEWTEKEW